MRLAIPLTAWLDSPLVAYCSAVLFYAVCLVLSRDWLRRLGVLHLQLQPVTPTGWKIVIEKTIDNVSKHTVQFLTERRTR